jgi:hypothetical protein
LIAAGLVGQRVFVIVLGYEDLNDHNELHHDPMMAVAAKLEGAPEAGGICCQRSRVAGPAFVTVEGQVN